MPGFTYKSYSFHDKDPIIDQIRTIYHESGTNYKWIRDNSGVSTTTLSKWFSGDTKRPQAATINAVLRALGYELGIVEFGQKVLMLPAMEKTASEKNMTRHQNVIMLQKVKAKMKKNRTKGKSTSSGRVITG